MGPMSIACGCIPSGSLLTYPAMLAQVRQAMAEVWDLAESVLGKPLIGFSIDQYIQRTQNSVPTHKPSMATDFEEGRDVEIESIVGEVLKAAKEIGRPMPILSTLYAILTILISERDRKKNILKAP